MYNPFPATVESSTPNLPENYYKISSSCPRKFPLWGSPVVLDSLQKVNPRSPTPPLALCRTFPHLLLQCGFDHLEDTRLTGWSSAQLTSLQLPVDVTECSTLYESLMFRNTRNSILPVLYSLSTTTPLQLLQSLISKPDVIIR